MTISHRSLRISPIAVQYIGHVIHVTTILLYCWRKFWWRNTRLYKLSIVFGIILTQFCINFSRQEHQIDVLYVSFNSWDSQVSAYTPFHFSFTVPLTKTWDVKTYQQSRKDCLMFNNVLCRRLKRIRFISKKSYYLGAGLGPLETIATYLKRIYIINNNFF